MAEGEQGPVEKPVLVDSQGKLTAAGGDVARAWVGEHWTQPRECPFHHGPTQWQIDSQILQFMGYTPGAPFANTVFPAIAVTCRICAYMVPLNAIIVGVVPPDPPEARQQASQDDAPVSTEAK